MPALSLKDFERDALDTLLAYAAIPCLSPDYDAQWAEHGYIDAATELLATWARERSFANVDVTIHRLMGRTPVLVVTVEATATGTATAVLYGHLDKQPPLGDWSDGLEPFTPVRRADRVYARGVADDGYSAFAALLALEAMEANGIAHSRCVVLIEASEESGSPDLEAYLDELAEHLGDVALMICLDSGALTYDRLWVTTSLRGMLHVQLTVKVLTQGQHSGSASGVVPSSFRILRQLLDRVEDAHTGDVLLEELNCEIPDVYVDDANSLASEFGDIIAKELPTLPGLELMGSSAQDRILRRTWFSTLSIVGMGGIPEPAIAGNVLRPSTTAVLSFRLPPTVDATRAGEAVRSALTRDVPSSAEVNVDVIAADGWLTPPLEPWLTNALDAASNDAFAHAPGFTGEGGTIPFLAFLGRRYPHVQFVATGVLGPLSNAHAIDEMLDLNMAVGVTNAVITILGAFANQEES
jgi:acetylornithine deacetylase/succinyl-diaminopimelate desuccinylase-like protein